MKIYSVWKSQDEIEPDIIIEGDDRTKIIATESGNIECMYKFWASTWEEAQAIYHLRQGWEPYHPLNPIKCVNCGEIIYASRDCWKCQ